ncbi:MAG: hypothetical protein LBK67_00830 [Coriobacteriales bacterium]|jgi:hypothetical protein|nr:hypothetical protein [Coriobacteriales bacterium]
MDSDTFESRLRYAVIVAFGLLFLLSYALTLLMLFGFSDPYSQGLVNADLGDMLYAVGPVLLIAVFGILMLLSVFKRRIFHVFVGFTLAFKLYVTIVVLMSFMPPFGFDAFSGNLMVWMIGDVLDLVLWCIPFSVYYLILAIRKRRN